MACNPKPIRQYYKRLYKSRKKYDYISTDLSNLWAYRHLRYLNPNLKKNNKIVMTSRAMGKTQLIFEEMIKTGKATLLAFHPEPDSGLESIVFDELSENRCWRKGILNDNSPKR